MTVTIPTKDVSEVKNVRCRGNYKKTEEDRNEDYIKKEMGIDEKI